MDGKKSGREEFYGSYSARDAVEGLPQHARSGADGRPARFGREVRTARRGTEPEDVDFVVVRENTEGLYANVFGFVRQSSPHEIAIQQEVNTRFGVERAVRYAYELARQRGASDA
jgi:isocitrate/isopropylmalate dehydrogenase